MREIDEPLFEPESSESSQDSSRPTVRESIRRLTREQSYSVLCVQGGGQPYGALVAFAFAEDLRHAVFATPTATRKFRLLSECSRVAMVIDNRASRADDLMSIEAVTATGDSQRLAPGRELERWSKLLLTKHPYLSSFVASPSCALFKVNIVRYLHVIRFQEVRQWIPTARA